MFDGFDTPFVQQTTAERVADTIREAIMRGNIGPGTQLPEHKLRDSLGVSRSTIREAFRMLTHEGLVQHDPYRGVSVPRLSEQDVQDIFRGRLALELAGVQAAGHADAPRVQRLTDAHAAFEDAIASSDWAAAFQADMDLHRGLVACIGSERLEQLFGAMLNELRLGYFTVGGVDSESLPRDRADHRAIVEAIRRDDLATATSLVRAHLEHSEALLLALMRENLQPAQGPAPHAS